MQHKLLLAKLAGVAIPTEPTGSIPRPAFLLDSISAFQENRISQADLDKAYDEALRDTIERFEQTGSTIISDGEQSKSSFATSPLVCCPVKRLQEDHAVASLGYVAGRSRGNSRSDD
jgi:hypothetical protein